MSRRFAAALAWLALTCLLAACSSTFPPDNDDAPALEVVEKGAEVPQAFAQNEIMSDAFLISTEWIDADGLRAFFEQVPGAGRSWLADAVINGRPAVERIVSAARASGVNPALLVIRMQVEASAVSPSKRPTAWELEAIMGCGCPDGRACDARFRGFEAQLTCAAQTFRAHFDASRRGEGGWQRGRTRISEDGYAVTPATHATAAHYAYTPWVLPRQGGNWLAWRVARDYIEAMRDAPPPVAPACATFADVPPTHPAFGEIEAGADAGWWTGCGGDRFCPGGPLSRGAVAMVLDRVLAPRSVTPTAPYVDVPAQHWAAGAIARLTAAGIVTGCGGDRFCPDAALTRAELAALLARATRAPLRDSAQPYADVPSTHWAARAIEALRPVGALGVCGPNRFCPDAATSRGQAAVAFARAFGLSPRSPCP